MGDAGEIRGKTGELGANLTLLAHKAGVLSGRPAGPDSPQGNLAGQPEAGQKEGQNQAQVQQTAKEVRFLARAAQEPARERGGQKQEDRGAREGGQKEAMDEVQLEAEEHKGESDRAKDFQFSLLACRGA